MTEVDPFAAPAGTNPLDDEWTAPKGGGDRMSPADVKGHLLIVRPLEFVENVNTSRGPADAVRMNVADLTAGTVAEDALWFGVLTIGLRRQIGATILGTMTQGTAKPGQDPPWILADATSDAAAMAKAREFKKANPAFWS